MPYHEDKEHLRVRLARGERLLGTVVGCSDLALAELLGESFDFLWVDLEHSPLNVSDVQDLAIAARAARASVLVRVPSAKSRITTVLLDIGVEGLIAPRIDNAAAADRFVDALRYPPNGSRGFANRRHTGFGTDGGSGSIEPLRLVQIESAEALENVDDIARVEGVDGLILGPSDLALDLGVASRLDSPALARAIKTVEGAATRAGIVAGLAAGGPEGALMDALGSTTLLAYSADMRIYASAIQKAASTVSAAWRGNAGRSDTSIGTD